MYVFVNVRVCVLHLSTYPLRTPLSWGSGGGCHWTMMDWFVRPLATIFFGGALGASSLSINLTQTQKERETNYVDYIYQVVIRMGVQFI